MSRRLACAHCSCDRLELTEFRPTVARLTHWCRTVVFTLLAMAMLSRLVLMVRIFNLGVKENSELLHEFYQGSVRWQCLVSTATSHLPEDFVQELVI